MRTWLVLAAIMLPVLAGGIYMAVGAERQTKADPAMEAIAAASAGGPVVVFTGPDHTVYYSPEPLPSDANPRADGRVTLVWFTNTTCGRCEKMRFAHQVAAEFRGRMVFVEKATDRDTAAARYQVGGAPAFVLIDARGVEVPGTRFGYEASADGFRSAVEAALATAGR